MADLIAHRDPAQRNIDRGKDHEQEGKQDEHRRRRSRVIRLPGDKKKRTAERKAECRKMYRGVRLGPHRVRKEAGERSTQLHESHDDQSNTPRSHRGLGLRTDRGEDRRSLVRDDRNRLKPGGPTQVIQGGCVDPASGARREVTGEHHIGHADRLTVGLRGQSVSEGGARRTHDTVIVDRTSPRVPD